MELDCVYQMKNLVKEYYHKKNRLSKELVETLDALNNERPSKLALKKKSIYESQQSDVLLGRKHTNLYTDLEYMRLSAEKDRIDIYRGLAKD